MYSVSDYGRMIADTDRMNAYEEALRTTVKPGDVVVDIGTGTGIDAFLACQLGARHVYAIEKNPAIQVARDIAKANGFEDKITFIQNLSTKVHLPEKADVMVSDIRGSLPLCGPHIPSIIDARKRFLKPDGIQIPQRDVLMIAGVQSDKIYRKYTIPWRQNPYKLNMEAARKVVINQKDKSRADPNEIFLKKRELATLDYTVITRSDVCREIQWHVNKSGKLHGFQVWFDAYLLDTCSFSTAPSAPELIYGNRFFPLCQEIKVLPGDVVTVQFTAKLVGESYIHMWNTLVDRDGKQIIRFKQNSLKNIPLPLSQLRKQSETYVPNLNTEGEIAQFILTLMSQKSPLGRIASKLMESYPDRFSSWEIALSHVGKFSKKYTW